MRPLAVQRAVRLLCALVCVHARALGETEATDERAAGEAEIGRGTHVWSWRCLERPCGGGVRQLWRSRGLFLKRSIKMSLNAAN